MKKALIIDANALIHRAWHALPPMTTPDGKLINAAYGFTSVLMKVLGEMRPEVLAVCWDTEAPTFRHEAMESYKAQREAQPDEFYAQIDDAKKLVEVLGGTNLALDGFEADDLLGTMAAKLSKQDYKVTILTGDKDAYQLINDKVSVLAFKKGVSETVEYTPTSLFETIGLHPEQIVDYKAMRGDTSDNIPGIKGIGEKTATELLQKFGDLKGIFKAVKDAKSDIKPGVRSKLVEGEQVAKETLPIVTIVTDVPIKVSEKELIRKAVDQEKLVEVFGFYGFRSLVDRYIKNNKENRPTSYVLRPTSLSNSKTEGRDTKYEIRNTDDGDKNSALELSREKGKVFLMVIEKAQGSLFESGDKLAVGAGDEVAEFGDKDLDGLKKILEDENIKKIGHNLKIVWHWADKNNIELKGLEFDCELAGYLISAGERNYDIYSLAVLYLQKVIKDGDVAGTMKAIKDLEPVLRKELKDQQLQGVLDKFEMPLIEILANMEKAGIKIDKKHFEELRGKLDKEKSALEKKMHKLAGEEFNPLSPKQLGHILFDVLGLSTKNIKRGKTGISTAASELEKLHGLHPLVDLIEQYRELAKLLSTYVETIPQLADKNGRVHTTFNQAVAATGRLSSSDPNMQNIPIRSELGMEVRNGFIAEKGFVLLSCDYSQVELRIAAAMAKDKAMLEAFEQGADIHTATAAKIWGLDFDKVTKDQRRVAKAINFGLIFGQGPQGLSRTADISVAEAKEFIAKYFEVFSGIKEYMDFSKAMAAKNGYIETLFGRRRQLPEINSPLPQMRAQAERMAINMPIQGTEADLIKLAMIEVAIKLPSICKEAKMLLQVHDELLLEVPEAEAKSVGKEVADIMENVVKIGCPIVVDANYAQRWGECK